MAEELPQRGRRRPARSLYDMLDAKASEECETWLFIGLRGSVPESGRAAEVIIYGNSGGVDDGAGLSDMAEKRRLVNLLWSFFFSEEGETE